MKGLKKLVLASAIIAASSSAFAMQAMDDDSMSATTGQDGITLSMSTNLTNLDVKWIDRDGIAGGGYNHSGAVHILGAGGVGDGLGISTSSVITLDVGGSAGDTTGNGQLKVGITSGATTVNLKNVSINVADAGATGSAIGTDTAILSFDSSAQLNIAAGATAAITLGNRTGGHFLTSTANLGTVSLTGLSINDVVGGGSIILGKLVLNTVSAQTAIDVTATGLTIDTTGTTIGEVGLEGIKLGSAASASIGDVYIANLNASTVISVTGH